jgi:hypothetical protein
MDTGNRGLDLGLLVNQQKPVILIRAVLQRYMPRREYFRKYRKKERG